MPFKNLTKIHYQQTLWFISNSSKTIVLSPAVVIPYQVKWEQHREGRWRWWSCQPFELKPAAHHEHRASEEHGGSRCRYVRSAQYAQWQGWGCCCYSRQCQELIQFHGRGLKGRVFGSSGGTASYLDSAKISFRSFVTEIDILSISITIVSLFEVGTVI